jgi:8-oxo-dGTP pyrophosphatase MutT (NUDIX family)
MATNEFNPAARPGPALRPRDAATLIIVRRDGGRPRVLMGRRHAGHRFMPGKYVFPGGRLDAADCRLAPACDLDPRVADKLLKRMRGGASPARARGLAMAAVRETFEEVGLLVARPHGGRAASRNDAWRRFLATGHAPDLSGLSYFARAITPPGRPRRFDTRFFVLAADRVANLDSPVTTASEEMLDIAWVTFEEATGLDLPGITKDILKRLEAALADPAALTPGAPASFQYLSGKSWRQEWL